MTQGTVKQRVITFLAYKNIGQGKFEKIVGISNGYISKLKGEPSAAIINKILEAYPEINKTWLLCGDGEMLITNPAMTNNIAIATGDDSNVNAGGTQTVNQAQQDVISELRKQLEDKDQEIEFLRNLVTTLTNK